jgi:disulfide bond formation protein DsbB
MKLIKKHLNDYYLHIITFIALIATLGSLALSDLYDLSACVLCWYQRICIYPIGLISVLAIIFKDKFVDKYILALATPGLFIAGYQYILQMSTRAGESALLTAACSADNPCSEIQFELFGFVTIPFLSLIAFMSIILLIMARFYLNSKSEI